MICRVKTALLRVTRLATCQSTANLIRRGQSTAGVPTCLDRSRSPCKGEASHEAMAHRDDSRTCLTTPGAWSECPHRTRTDRTAVCVSCGTVNRPRAARKFPGARVQPSSRRHIQTLILDRLPVAVVRAVARLARYSFRHHIRHRCPETGELPRRQTVDSDYARAPTIAVR